jgi:hypothetical protein
VKFDYKHVVLMYIDPTSKKTNFSQLQRSTGDCYVGRE